MTDPVLTVAPLKEETEMLRATEKITALNSFLTGISLPAAGRHYACQLAPIFYV